MTFRVAHATGCHSIVRDSVLRAEKSEMPGAAGDTGIHLKQGGAERAGEMGERPLSQTCNNASVRLYRVRRRTCNYPYYNVVISARLAVVVTSAVRVRSTPRALEPIAKSVEKLRAAVFCARAKLRRAKAGSRVDAGFSIGGTRRTGKIALVRVPVRLQADARLLASGCLFSRDELKLDKLMAGAR